MKTLRVHVATTWYISFSHFAIKPNVLKQGTFFGEHAHVELWHNCCWILIKVRFHRGRGLVFVSLVLVFFFLTGAETILLQRFPWTEGPTFLAEQPPLGFFPRIFQPTLSFVTFILLQMQGLSSGSHQGPSLLCYLIQWSYLHESHYFKWTRSLGLLRCPALHKMHNVNVNHLQSDR